MTRDSLPLIMRSPTVCLGPDLDSHKFWRNFNSIHLFTLPLAINRFATQIKAWPILKDRLDDAKQLRLAMFTLNYDEIISYFMNEMFLFFCDGFELKTQPNVSHLFSSSFARSKLRANEQTLEMFANNPKGTLISIWTYVGRRVDEPNGKCRAVQLPIWVGRDISKFEKKKQKFCLQVFHIQSPDFHTADSLFCSHRLNKQNKLEKCSKHQRKQLVRHSSLDDERIDRFPASSFRLTTEKKNNQNRFWPQKKVEISF